MAALDQLLRHVQPPPAELLARVRSEARVAMVSPAPSWRREAGRVVLATWGSALALSAVLLATGNASIDDVLHRLSTVVPLMLLGGAGAWAAIAPGRRWLRLVVGVAGVAAAMGIVLLRETPLAASTTPEWVCTLNHLALGVGPLWLALVAFRRMAPNPARSIIAGVGVGTVGAIAGEVGCSQAWQHVLVFHISAWAMVTLAAVIGARRLRRSSYAP